MYWIEDEISSRNGKAYKKQIFHHSMVVNSRDEIPDLYTTLWETAYEGFRVCPVLPMPGITLDWSIHKYYLFVAGEGLFGRIRNWYYDGENLKPFTYHDFRGGQVTTLITNLVALEDDANELGDMLLEKYFPEDVCQVSDEDLLGFCDEITRFLHGLHPAIYGSLIEHDEEESSKGKKDVRDALIVSQAMASRIVYYHEDSMIQKDRSEEIFAAFIENYRIKWARECPEFRDKTQATCERAYKQVELLLDFPDEEL